ncbi:hypothetical protein J2S14_002675 [Lederbergia wuyishanensis]|uniref:Uncharacterized protein n=1 Tax=Lederbergia wuyishanensis TaxID=1347903 RepID=A0ABU0D624_9BACI|nr:hypothetical protein [Lederbergia wuyishanensis]
MIGNSVLILDESPRLIDLIGNPTLINNESRRYSNLVVN